MKISEEVLFNRLKKWQENPVFHELTCGNNSRHSLLEPKRENGKTILRCKDCDYIQKRFPKLFYNEDFDKAYKHQEEAMKRLEEISNTDMLNDIT